MDILVTGGASGIGKASAKILKQKGHKVTLFDNNSEALEELEKEGFNVYIGDVRNEEDVQNVLDKTSPEVLINSAGFYEIGAIRDMGSKAAEKIIGTNFHGTLNFMRKAAPIIEENDGRIVNISSVAGKMSIPFYGVYCGSKHAIEAATEAFNYEEEFDIVLVEPGPVKTGFNWRARQAVEKYLPSSKFSEKYEEFLKQETKGISTEKAAKTVVKAATTNQPKFRYRTSKKFNLIIWMHRTLPRKIWKKMVELLQ